MIEPDGTQPTTSWLMIIGLLCVGLYDIYLGYRYGESATITEYVRWVAARWPIIPLMVGVLIGHLFWGK